MFSWWMLANGKIGEKCSNHGDETNYFQQYIDLQLFVVALSFLLLCFVFSFVLSVP